MTLAAGDALPPLALEATQSGVRVDAAWLAARRRTVIVVHGAKATDAPKEVAKGVRARWADPKEVAFVSVVDLRSFAGVWRKVAQAQLKATHTKMSERAVAAGLRPEDAVVMCPDWDGAAAALLQVDRPDEQPQAIVVDGAARVMGVAMGKDIAAGAVALAAS